MAKKSSSGLFVGGMLIGTAVGTVIGILAAPRSGRETRQIVKKSAEALPELAEDLSTTVQLQAGRMSESAVQNWEETLVRLREAIAAGLSASQLKAEELQDSSTVMAESSSIERKL